MFFINFLLLFFCSLLNPAWGQDINEQPGIKVVYPPVGGNIEAPSTFLIGQVDPGTSLNCNGSTVRINKEGFFAHVVSLQYGSNKFLLTSINSSGQEAGSFQCIVVRKVPTKPIATNELKLVDMKPNNDLGVTPGDILNFSVRATPQSTVTVKLAEHSIVLSSATKSHIETTTDVAYGKTFHRFETNDSDLYRGSYRVTTADRFYSIRPEYKLVNQMGSLSSIGKSKISTTDSLTLAKTTNNPTVVRLGPGLARTTPLVDGVKVLIDGWVGDNMRCLYSSNCHVWIKKEDLLVQSISESRLPLSVQQPHVTIPDASAPQAVAQTINIIEDDYGAQVRLPLTERLPYQIEQKLNPNCLVIKVYGVQPDTDWITSEPKASASNKCNLDTVSWREAEDNVYEITIHFLGKRQWGYKAYYDGTTLCIGIKAAPTITKADSLSGIKICIDPGHGGTERGSIGCSGIPESELNLEIANKLKERLAALGATVIMTRLSQSENPSLNDRVKIAANNNVDFLVSIHNNALPDGRDPWKEHGTSSYYYHPQSIELATCLKNSVKAASNFLDLGARYQNLALVRGTAMPSVLLEIGFMINPDEFAQLINPQFQSEIAQSVVEGIKRYLNDRKQQITD